MRRSPWIAMIVAIAMITLAGCGSEEPRLTGATAESEGHQHAGGAAHHAEDGHHAAVTEEQAGPGAQAAAGSQGAGPRPTRVLEDGARLFGVEPQGERAATELAQIVASPSTFDGQIVRTSGTIERVCQRMGCWMELRGENTEAVRVPMAGHAFFLPRDAAGRSATIEGRVTVQELSPETREHLASEGALATASSLSIDATSVIVR